MRINKVKFTNYCQHASREDVLGPGVIGIIGPNGSGKSNWLKGVLRSFTGRTSNAGKNEDDVTWGSDKGGSVETFFSVRGAEGRIKRNLATSGCSMDFGDKKLRKATEIDEAIFSILGVSPKLLQDIVFVEQGMIEQILFQRPAERGKALQTLFGTERAEAIRVLLTTELTNCVADSRSDTINTLKAELANLSDRHAMLVEEQRKQSVDLLPLETVASLKTTIQRSDSYALAKEALSGVELKLASYRSQFGEARELKNAKTIEFEALDAALNDTRKDYESSKFRLASVDSARKTNATRKQLEELIAARKAMLSKPAPEDPSKVDFSELNRLSRELREVEEKLSQWRSFLRTFSDSKVDASCPTCFQSVTASSIESIKRAIDESVPVHDRLAADVGLQEASRRHMTEAFESHKRNVEMAQTTLVQLEGQLAGLPEAVNIDESSLEGMRSLIEMFMSTERQQSIVRHGVSVQTERERNMFSSMTNAALEVDSLRSRMQQAPDPAEVEKAQRKLQQHEEGRVQAARLEGEAKQVSERMSQVRFLLEQRELEEKRLGGVKQYREMCERAKTLLHRDNLPNLVGQAYMKAINTHLAHYLEAFDVPFRARMMEDNSMVCNFGDTEVPAGRLSGGQRVALGLTWRFAVYNLFVNNLGLLILDEPTVYLDKERIDSVYRLLEQVKTYSKAADLQLLVVTHEERLAGVFDQVIKL